MPIYLTTSVAEDLHQLILASGDSRRLHDRIAYISDTTLSGLAEYECMRLTYPWLPMLPVAITNSILGQSLELARANYRTLQSRGNRPAAEDMRVRDAEFAIFSDEIELLSDRIQFFQIRFNKSAQNAGFPTTLSSCLQAGLNEMMDNAVRHSRSKSPMMAGYAVRPGLAQFCVVDVGRGVLASLKDLPKYRGIGKHSDAIRLALHDGVTNDPNGRGGHGFNDIFKALAAQWGLLRFRSRGGCLTMDGAGISADAGTITFPPDLPGFQVAVLCCTTSIRPKALIL